MVHLVVALHRIAKSTDFQQLRHSAPLREQLAELAKNAAEAEPGIKLIELWVSKSQACLITHAGKWQKSIYPQKWGFTVT